MSPSDPSNIDTPDTYLPDCLFSHPHTIIALEALLPKVDSSCRPMGIVMVDWNEDHILGKDVHFLRPLG